MTNITMKYLLQQPKSLEELTTETLSSWIAIQAKKFLTPIWELRRQDNPKETDDELTRKIENLRNSFYRSLPKKLHDDLASKTIKYLTELLEKLNIIKHDRIDETCSHSDTQMKVIGRIAETSFTENLSSLTVSGDAYEMLREPLSSKSHMLTGLVTLELNLLMPHYHNDTTIEFELIQLLKNLHSLKHLTIIRVCTGEMLKCIAINCTSIEELDLSSSANLNDGNIKILDRLENLRSINLINTHVGLTGLETLLLGNKNLEDIVIVAINNSLMPQFLNEITISPEKFPKFFRLTTYRSAGDTFKELKLVAEMCPLITDLFVRKSFKDSTSNISAITSLTNLRKLTLVNYKFYTDKIREVLEEIGHNLVHLNLLRFKEIDLRALIAISQFCPNLHRLKLQGCSFLNTKSASHTQELKAQPFQYLNTLIFLGRHYSYRYSNLKQCELAQEAALLLLSNCLNVEFIEFNKTWLTDEWMLRVLDKNPMVHLREMKIRDHENDKGKDTITAPVLDQIIENCRNNPEFVLVDDLYFESDLL